MRRRHAREIQKEFKLKDLPDLDGSFYRVTFAGKRDIISAQNEGGEEK